MRLDKYFDALLADLVNRKMDSTRRSLWPEVGKAKSFSRKYLKEAVGRLNALAERQLMRSRSLGRLLEQAPAHSWRVTGRGRDRKVEEFKGWFRDLDVGRDFVYVIWNRTRCLYVGRTGNGPSRTTQHFKTAWFLRATRVEIYTFSGKRGVPRFECLLTHKLNPSEARKKPGAKRYHSYCPVCKVQNTIRLAVVGMFAAHRARS